LMRGAKLLSALVAARRKIAVCARRGAVRREITERARRGAARNY